MNQPLDSETQKVLREGQTIADFTKSDGWNLAKSKLIEKLSTLDSLSSTIFDKKTPEQLSIELQARAGAIELIRQWLAEVEGWADQHNSNKELTSDVQEEILLRL